MNKDSNLIRAIEVIQGGDEKGQGMVAKLTLPSGLEIIGLPTENFYEEDWDYGPSWNYLVLTEKPFLVDSGRAGMNEKILAHIKKAGLSEQEIDTMVVSHGHEDHDGGLYQLVQTLGARVKAHGIYKQLIQRYPEKAPVEGRKNFPAACWHCFMPDRFSTRFCGQYHQERSQLEIDPLEAGSNGLGTDIRIYHLPGHSPDALAIQLGEEAIIVGDTVLPDITPYPSQEKFFDDVKDILAPQYAAADMVYGLRAYIKSLKMLKKIGRRFPDLIVLPAHRLFYHNQWQALNLQSRVDDLIRHHIDRCSAILDIINQGEKTAQEIAQIYFPANLLKGLGKYMAANEILSHCELLTFAGDIVVTNENKYVAEGNTNFESFIQSLENNTYCQGVIFDEYIQG